mmetsp:Transcript_52314/g.111411  ORF Transcript_52314/g.111411 Transcript_52314/m.111411 type:complete len:87 (-) Transcript_52314:126-386(-)
MTSRDALSEPKLMMPEVEGAPGNEEEEEEEAILVKQQLVLPCVRPPKSVCARGDLDANLQEVFIFFQRTRKRASRSGQVLNLAELI